MTQARNSLCLWVALASLCACQSSLGASPPRSAPVLDGSLNIGLPKGYCIDRSAGQEKQDQLVVMMGRCVENSEAPPAMILVTTGEAGSGEAMAAGGPALAAFFGSEQGRATLSRSGRARDVDLITALGRDTAFIMHLADKEIGEYWRALVTIGGRLVTISATGTDSVALPPEVGEKVVNATLQAMLDANP